MPFDVSLSLDQSYTGGLRLSAINTTQASGTSYNIVLAARNATIPHLVVNDQKNQLHLFPQGNAEVNTSYVQKVIVGSDLFVRKTLQVGTSQDTARLISALDNTMTSGAARYFTLGRDNSSRNQAEISFYYDGGNSTANRLDFGFYGGALMYLTAAGRLGLGTSSPSCCLDVATGENSVTTTTNISINTYSYNVSSNAWTNLGGGPISVNMCARFRGSIWVQDKVYATSDRRLKEQIEPLDFTLEHYKKLNPVTYKWKNQQSMQLGLIAQEVKDVCGEAVQLVENENMKAGGDDEPEGYQMTVDYNAINIMNVTALKKLIDRVEQ